MSSQKCMKRISLQDKLDVFLLAEYKTDFKLCLKILNLRDNEAYAGQASDIELRSQAASIRLSFTDFIQKATDALLQNTEGQSGFLYCLDKINDTYMFKWKSIDSEETIINLGKVEMKKRDAGFVFTEILLSISEEMQKLNTDVQYLNKELNTSRQQLADALNQLSVATDLKDTLEKELYSKFILVLNEKKRKIKELEMNFKTNPGSRKNNIPKKKVAKLSLSSSESSNEVDGALEIHQPGPSTVRKRNSLSFFEETKNITTGKIRNRKAAVSKTSKIPDDPIVSNPTKCVDNSAEESNSADSLMDFL